METKTIVKIVHCLSMIIILSITALSKSKTARLVCLTKIKLKSWSRKKSKWWRILESTKMVKKSKGSKRIKVIKKKKIY